MNEGSAKLKLKYKNKKGEIEKLGLEFESVDEALKIGEKLGNQTNLNRSISQENKTKKLLLNGFYVIVSIIFTYVFSVANPNNFVRSSSSTLKTQRNEAIFKFVHDTIGGTGILILGTVVTIFLIYKLVENYKKPKKDIIYQ